jgi:hypothetical protein
MRTRLMIATATAAALLGGAAFAQPTGATGSNFSQNTQPAAVNPPPSNQLPAGVATGNAAVNEPTPSGQAGTGDVTAPSGSAAGAINSTGRSDAVTVAPAAGAPAERAPAASAGTDLITNGPVPDTRANRAKYGQPLSNAGRLTKPAGN